MRNKVYSTLRKSKLNIPLLIGTAIISLLIFASIYPEYVYPADPFGMQRLSYDNENNTSNIITPPIPPNKDYPWGTDEKGRDIKSLIVYGTKQTMLIACIGALLRLLIALPLAILAGYKNRFAAALIKLFNILFSAIPLVLAVLIFSGIGIFNFVIKNNIVRSVVWLVLLGWSRLAYLLSEKVSEILEQDFIEGEIAIGKNKYEIATQNILPHLIPSITVMYFLEVAMVLLLMSQVGVLGMVFSGGYYTASGGLAIPAEFDWTSMLMFAYLLFGSDKMWLVTFPAAAFAVGIIGFNLFGEGLRLEFEKRTSRVITFIKRIPGFFSIPKLLYEIKDYRQNRRSLSVKAIVYILILAILFMPPLPSKYKFDTHNSMAIVKELSDPKYEGRHTGSQGVQKAAEYIAYTLKSYGVKPLGEDYIWSYDVPVTHNIKNAELKVITSEGKQIDLIHRNDFYILSPFNVKAKAKIVVMTPQSLQNFNASRTEELRDSIILVDIRRTDVRTITGAMMNLSFIIKPKAVIMIEEWESESSYWKINGVDKTFDSSLVVRVSSNKGDELLSCKNLEAELSVETDTYLNAKGYNVAGYIPGTNPKYAKECIVIGSALDNIGNDKNVNYPGSLSAAAVAAEIEIARVMSQNGIKPERTIIFGFWDGSYTDYRGAKAFKHDYINKNRMDTYYIEIANLASVETDKLMLDTTKTFPKSKISQSYIRAFKSVARAKDVPVTYSRMLTTSMEDFLGAGKEALILGSDGVNQYRNTANDNYQAVDPEKVGQYGQVILDSIIKVANKKE